MRMCVFCVGGEGQAVWGRREGERAAMRAAAAAGGGPGPAQPAALEIQIQVCMPGPGGPDSDQLLGAWQVPLASASQSDSDLAGRVVELTARPGPGPDRFEPGTVLLRAVVDVSGLAATRALLA